MPLARESADCSALGCSSSSFIVSAAAAIGAPQCVLLPLTCQLLHSASPRPTHGVQSLRALLDSRMAPAIEPGNAEISAVQAAVVYWGDEDAPAAAARVMPAAAAPSGSDARAALASPTTTPPPWLPSAAQFAGLGFFFLVLLLLCSRAVAWQRRPPGPGAHVSGRCLCCGCSGAVSWDAAPPAERLGPQRPHDKCGGAEAQAHGRGRGRGRGRCRTRHAARARHAQGRQHWGPRRRR